MATESEPAPHPGDVIQDSNGLIYLVTEVRAWGVGALMRWTDRSGAPLESYHRFKAGQYFIVGPARLLPPAVSEARRASLTTAQAVEREGRQ